MFIKLTVHKDSAVNVLSAGGRSGGYSPFGGSYEAKSSSREDYRPFTLKLPSSEGLGTFFSLLISERLKCCETEGYIPHGSGYIDTYELK
jgi:hypothetical protein